MGKEESNQDITRETRNGFFKTQEIFAEELAKLGEDNVKARKQAERAFRLAIIFASIGLLFFIASILFLLLLKQSGNLSIISLISGSLIEVLSALNFYN